MDTDALRTALPDRIETGRLSLRMPVRSDVPAIAKLANDAEIYAMTSLPHPYDESDAQHFVDTIARSRSEHAYAITLRDGTLVGMIGLHLSTDPIPEIGYWLGRAYWGVGFATEAARGVIETLYRIGQCSTLSAKARSENRASRAVLEKLGFVRMQETISECGSHKDVKVTQYQLSLATEAP